MKKIGLISGLALLLGLFAFTNKANAQAVVIQDEITTIWTGYMTYESYYHQIVVTPSGNIKFKAKFWLDPADPVVPENGVAKYIASINWLYEGVYYYMVDENCLVLANGNCILEFNFNPAGYSFP